MLQQITFLSSFLFITGIAALFLKQSNSKYGIIIAYTASVINFTAFSNYNAFSADGQVFAIAALLVLGIHLIVQRTLIGGQ